MGEDLSMRLSECVTVTCSAACGNKTIYIYLKTKQNKKQKNMQQRNLSSSVHVLN